MSIHFPSAQAYINPTPSRLAPFKTLSEPKTDGELPLQKQVFADISTGKIFTTFKQLEEANKGWLFDLDFHVRSKVIYSLGYKNPNRDNAGKIIWQIDNSKIKIIDEAVLNSLRSEKNKTLHYTLRQDDLK